MRNIPVCLRPSMWFRLLVSAFLGSYHSRLNRAMRTSTLRVVEKGTVKFYNESKGLGLIRVEGSGQEIFVHKTGSIGYRPRKRRRRLRCSRWQKGSERR